MSLEKIRAGNKTFSQKFSEEKEFYLDLVENGQHPKVLWIGCSDSRVVPEFVVNAKAGELFVMRNIANIIPPKDADISCTGSVLEYAVQHLKVEHIIVCGHTNCGGITACVQGVEEGNHIHDWLQFAEPAKKVAKNKNGEDLILDTIKENVLQQKKNLLSFDYVKEIVENGNLEIHCWLYDLKDGKISSYNRLENVWLDLD
ncbi:MAG: hypothetical protein K9N09_02245 [Candidatus Cloacimonetes bacterium]|nr:hypothetical protein [Candidatus Cloacimonadota bacterium]MCF7813380.1 hypothetical protein [Candidatus Cloacimonadota bacterium]MCF7867495.1 hypothetical protein [Candidatus Cloacimonadota bacterium]MCF7883002.1 hypothetical protein [Candidatus Cloacimonadota bacterium]